MLENGATSSLSARWSQLRYGGQFERNTRLFRIEGRYRYPITPKLTFEGKVAYRMEDDTLSGDDTGVDFDVSLEWSIRKTDIQLSYEFGRFQDDFTRQDGSAFYLQIVRHF